MNTKLFASSLDLLVEELRTNKHYCEFKMTKKGFTNDEEKYYTPSELTMIDIYSFEEVLYPGQFSFVYILRDSNGVIGYSKDLLSEYRMNEEKLYHWFITKMLRQIK